MKKKYIYFSLFALWEIRFSCMRFVFWRRVTFLWHKSVMSRHVTSRAIVWWLLDGRMTGWLSVRSAPHTSTGGKGNIHGEPRVSPIIALNQVPPSWQTERPWKCARPQESPPLAWRGEIWLCPFHVDEPGEIHRRGPAHDLCHFFLLTAATSCLCWSLVAYPCVFQTFLLYHEWSKVKIGIYRFFLHILCILHSTLLILRIFFSYCSNIQSIEIIYAHIVLYVLLKCQWLKSNW